MKRPAIVFMGTPDFAVPTLEALHQTDFEISLVVTQPDRPKGRGRLLAPPPVKKAADNMGYHVVQPPNVREVDFIDRLKGLTPDFLVVVAFGQILPKAILDIPVRGAVNVHASLLPKYRGPAPIQWALIRGETETGITTMLMERGVDTGDMLLSAKISIGDDDTAGRLHDRLAHLGADLLVKTLAGLWDGTLLPRSQKHNEATYAPMLKKEDGRIDWHQSAQTLDAFIRAMTPWPGAFCFCSDRRLKILKALAIQCDLHERPGMVVPSFPDELRIATGQGVLSVLEIQGASGKRLTIKDFLHGHPIAPGERFD